MKRQDPVLQSLLWLTAARQMLRFVCTVCALAIALQGLATFKIHLIGSAHLHTTQNHSTVSSTQIYDLGGRGLAPQSRALVQNHTYRKHQHNSVGYHTHLADVPALIANWLNQGAHNSAAYLNSDQDISPLILLALLPPEPQRFSVLNTFAPSAIASDIFKSIDQKRIERPPCCYLTA